MHGDLEDRAANVFSENSSSKDDPYADLRAGGYSSYRLYVFSWLEGPSGDLGPIGKTSATIWQFFVALCIITSVATFLVGSLAVNWGRDVMVLDVIEIVVISVFTFDYVARLALTPDPRFVLPYSWRCVKPPRSIATSRQLKTGFVWHFLNLVDLFSILPFYIELVLQAATGQSNASGQAFAAVRVLRLFRLARVLKFGKYVAILQTIGLTIRRSISAFMLLVFSVLVAGLLYGSLEFYAENLSACTFDEQAMLWVYTSNGAPSPYQSVFDGVWWGVVTLTTVGYGDKFPVSWPGQVVAVATILSGLVVLAFPIAIISGNFGDVVSEQKAEAAEKKRACELDHKAVEHANDQDLILAMRVQLRKQADALNNLQGIVETLANSWREEDATLQILEQRFLVRDDLKLTSVTSGRSSNDGTTTRSVK